MSARRSRRRRTKPKEQSAAIADPSGPQDLPIRSFSITRSGPIPDALALAQYDQIVPGSAARIFDEYEAQSRHRRELEATVIRADVQAQGRGQTFGLVIGVGALVLAGYFGYLGLPSLAISTVIIDIGGLAAVFVTGRMLGTQERKQRWDAFLRRIGRKK